MIHDLDELGQERLLGYDLCIVGSGPAGMVLAAELAESGLRICVLESGLARPSRHGDRLRAVQSEGITIKDWSRERVLGGASTTWAGLSSPLDAVDLEARPFLRFSGWPLAREELLPYWEAAARRYRFAPLPAYGPSGFAALKATGDAVLRWQRIEEKVFLAAGEPQDFGKEWRHVFRHPDVDLYLDATLLRLETAEAEGDGAAAGVTTAAPRNDAGRTDGTADGTADGGRVASGTGPGVPPRGEGAPRHRVRRGVLATRSGRRVLVEAAVFVLAAGGIENARLLLLSTDACAAGLGNERDVVGRFLMNHPKSYHGVVRLRRPVRALPYHFGCLHGGHAGYAGLRLAEAVQRERGLLNSYVRFEPLFPWSDNAGVEAFVLLMKRSGRLLAAWKERQGDGPIGLRDYSETGDDSALQNERRGPLGWLAVVGLVLVNLPVVLRYAVARLRRTRAPLVASVRLRNFMEMEPDPENRVELGEQHDAHGQPLPRVRHDSSALDRRSLVALHEVLQDELAGNGFGQLETALATADPWPVDQDASHHMGATRMGTDPATSVVDPDLRVHGVQNVYVAGASVFPTSGCANPTFTIVALSIRLAEHLRTEVFGRAAAAGARVPARPAAPSCATEPAPSASRLVRVLVVGAGRRVRTDVLPALAALPGRYEVAGVVARGARTLEIGGRAYATEPLAAFDRARLAKIDLVYLAVSKGAVPEVLTGLLERRASRAALLVDTPVLLFRHLHHAHLLRRFREVWVPEDCARLPWLDLVRRASGDRGPLGELQEVVLERSAWRYHGLALMKELLGCREIVAARRRRTGAGTARVDVSFANGTSATMLEPRDYAAGHLRLVGERAVASDAREPGDALRLSLLVDGARATGFRLGDLSVGLAEWESALLGPVQAGDTPTSRMEDCKRVGLARLLVDLHDGRGGYPLAEALEDMVVDHLLDRAGRFRPWGPLDVKRPLGRRVLGGMTRLLPGR